MAGLGELWDTMTGFPAIVLGILLVPVAVYWIGVIAGAADVDLFGDGAGDGLGAGAGDGADVDADAGADAGGGWWQALGLAGVPLTVSLSLVLAIAWFVALVATAAANTLAVSPAVRATGGTAALAVALLVGVLGASALARPLGRLFATAGAEGRADFVGRTCTVRTTVVTDSFGQAEATDPSGASVLVQVRLAGPTELRQGMEALIVHYDPAAEVYLVCPVDEVWGAAGTASRPS